MGKICPKCRYERRPDETVPDYECPRCGVVYAKFDPARPAAPVVTEPSVRVAARAELSRVVVTDVDVPFWRLVRLWIYAAVAAVPALLFVGLFFGALGSLVRCSAV